MRWFLAFLIVVIFTGCNQYMCYDGSYVEDPYDCYNRGGLSYFYKAKSNSSSSYAGQWRITLLQNSGSCPGIPKTFTRTVSLSQTDNRLSSRLTGFGAIRGTLRNKRARLSLQQRTPCKVSGSSDVFFVSQDKLNLSGSISIDCGAIYQCKASFLGSGVRK